MALFTRHENLKLIAGFTLAGIVVLAGCSGEVTYEEKKDPVQKSPASRDLKPKAGEILQVTVMPLSITPSKDPAINKTCNTPTFQKRVWTLLKTGVDKAPNLKRVALPKGAEADEIIQKTMRYAAGLLPAKEFAKAKKFQVSDRFLYGAVTINTVVEQKLRGADKKTYQAEAFLRLVDGKTFKYSPAVGKGRNATLDTAVVTAIEKALAKYN